VLLGARSQDKLVEVQQKIELRGGESLIHICDLSNPQDADRLVREVLDQYGHVDLLVNNAGRSIRRGVSHSYDRYHDFERSMRSAARSRARSSPTVSVSRPSTCRWCARP